MKIVGLMMVKNEQWILNYSLPIAMLWVDELVILNHNSTDNTADILQQTTMDYPGRIHLLYSDVSDWPEMTLRQQTLDKGREVGGTHFAIIDGDEAITADVLPHIKQLFLDLTPRHGLNLRMIPAWRSPTQYRIDPCVWTKGRINLGWCDYQRIAWVAKNGYHLHARLPSGVRGCTTPISVSGGVVHFEFADHERLKWKHRWYKLHEAVVYPDKPIDTIDQNYNQALDERGLITSPMQPQWRWYAHESNIYVGQEPWHVEACKSLYAAADLLNRASGLDLWGWKPEPVVT